MLQFQESVGCNNHSEGAGRIKNRSLHAQESSARCEITDRFQPGQGRSRSHRTSARRKGSDRRHRRQERDRCLQSVGHCVHDGCGYSDSKPREGIAGRARCHWQTCAAGKVRALQTFNYRGCKTEIGGKAMSKTMSIRMDRDNYEFLREITKEERSDLSKAVRDLVTRGRILLAVERYKKGEASLGRAAELAGLPLGQMITILTEFGVESRLEKDDYLQGLRNLHKVW